MASGCQFGPYTFACTHDAACGAGGICELNGFCSFPDSTCPSGRRFGDLGGPSAGQCVGGQPLVDGGDTSIDGRVSDAVVGTFCYGSAPYTICFASPPIGMLTVSTSTPFDTTAGISTGTQLTCVTPSIGGAGACVIAAGTITISSSLRAIGTRPLVLVASDTINVPTSIDVGSHRLPTESLGASADPTSGCNAGTPPVTAGGTSGGGAGGSLVGAGGNGGSGSGAGGGTGGAHGTAPGIGTILRGGCPGQEGAGAGKGSRGHGGGAVFLIAGKNINVGGTIEAGGEGGAGATGASSGGGGGGAGGMIGLDAPIITVTGTLIANGGGGGEGGNSTTAGNAGADAVVTTSAPGGSGSTATGGDGGNGSAGAAGGSGGSGLDGGANAGGGGGGGGGAGLIKGPPASLGNKVSPAATP
jgi:hypothetical protein